MSKDTDVSKLWRDIGVALGQLKTAISDIKDLRSDLGRHRREIASISEEVVRLEERVRSSSQMLGDDLVGLRQVISLAEVEFDTSAQDLRELIDGVSSLASDISHRVGQIEKEREEEKTSRSELEKVEREAGKMKFDRNTKIFLGGISAGGAVFLKFLEWAL